MIYNCAIIWPNQHPHHGSSRLHPLLRPHPQPLQDQDTLPQEVTVYQVEVTMIMMTPCIVTTMMMKMSLVKYNRSIMMKNVWRSRCRLQWEGWTAGPRPLSASLHKKWSSSQDFRFLSTSFFFQFFISFTFIIFNIIPINIALLHSILPILILIFFISFLLCTPLLHPYHDHINALTSMMTILSKVGSCRRDLKCCSAGPQALREASQASGWSLLRSS